MTSPSNDTFFAQPPTTILCFTMDTLITSSSSSLFILASCYGTDTNVMLSLIIRNNFDIKLCFTLLFGILSTRMSLSSLLLFCLEYSFVNCCSFHLMILIFLNVLSKLAQIKQQNTKETNWNTYSEDTVANFNFFSPSFSLSLPLFQFRFIYYLVQYSFFIKYVCSFPSFVAHFILFIQLV